MQELEAPGFAGPVAEISLTAPYDLLPGDGFLVGSIFAVAFSEATAGDAVKGQVRGQLQGVFTLAKVGSQAWAIGDLIYWDNDNRYCTKTASGNVRIGVAVAAAGAGSNVITGRVHLSGGPAVEDPSGGGGGGGEVVTVEITTGASPIDFDPNDYPAATEIVLVLTSGGTKGDEILNILNYTFTHGTSTPWAAPALFGNRITAYLASQTNGSDVVKVTLNGGDNIEIIDLAGARVGIARDNVIVLDFQAAEADLHWISYEWAWDNSNYDNSGVIDQQVHYVPANTYGWPDDGAVLRWKSGSGQPLFVAANILGLDGNITTGASPTNDFSPVATRNITSGGSGGVEQIVMPSLNSGYVGFRRNYYWITKTNPSDEIDFDTSYIRNGDGSALSQVRMTDEGAALILEFTAPSVWTVRFASPGVCTPDFIAAAPKIAPADWYKYINLVGIQSSDNIHMNGADILKADFSYSTFPSIDIGSCFNLDTLRCKNAVATTYLDASHCNLSSVDISGSSALETLYLNTNSLPAVDLSDCSAVLDLNVAFNPLGTVDVSACTALTALNVGATGITALDVSTNVLLQTLLAFNNGLTSLDVTANTALTNLQVNGNEITSAVDISANTALVTAYFNDSPIPSITVSTLPSMHDFRAIGCALDQASVDAILVACAANAQNNGTANLSGGTNATPSGTGLAAKATLEGRGWTVTVN